MITIATVNKEDYLELIELWERSVRATHHFLAETYIKTLKPLLLNHYFDAVELRSAKDEEGTILGFCGVHDSNLEMLFICPEARAKGIGKLLTLHAIKEQAVTKVDVNESNEEALGFYKHLGFEVVGRSEVDGQGQPYPLLHLALEDDKYTKINRDSWNQKSDIHLDSEFYDVDAFINGKISLNEIELKDLGDVEGKSLLHLQCHFGLDSLSWVRQGASVTAVDLSPRAIEIAEDLSKKTGLECNFICSDVYKFKQSPPMQYDIVYTSYGAICWLEDINRWAKVVVENLKPGGTFYMAEFHPFYDIFSGYSYFHKKEPDIEENETYTENSDGKKTTMATWSHPIADVVSALLDAGLTITQLKEYPYSPYNCFDNMEERQEGQFYLKHKDQDIPLIYTLKAINNN